MINNTLSRNNAPVGGNIFNNGPAASPLRVTNNIIANPLAGGNCAGNPVVNGGNNLQFPALTCGILISSANPLLMPLAFNGGPTQTMALAAGSPAIDKGNNAVCAAAPVANRDQRNVFRPLDGDGNGSKICDIGAFER